MEEHAKPETQLMTYGAHGVLGLMHGKGGSLGIPMPYERDIFLFETLVAGTTHLDDPEELKLTLHVGDRLDFFREPENPYDEKAIVVKDATGTKVGYVPREDNVVFSRLMDAGKLLFGRIDTKEMRGDWLRLTMKIYLHE